MKLAPLAPGYIQLRFKCVNQTQIRFVDNDASATVHVPRLILEGFF